jgi:hypothetical protein
MTGAPQIMANRLADILDNGESRNGTRALLTEIRKHQKDMPPECRDDMTFGALVVLHDLGVGRGKQISRNTILGVLNGLAAFLLFLIMISLHGDVPWLSNLAVTIFGS